MRSATPPLTPCSPMTTRSASPQRDPAPKRRAADVAYDAIEAMISTLQLQPGSPVVEAEIVESTGLGRTPVREALTRLNPQLPPPAIEDAVAQLTHHDFSRSLLQHNQAFHKLVRDGVPVSFKNAQGQLSHTQAKVIDFRNPAHNRFLVVRELKLAGLRTPNYNRRADLVCFVNGL
eukprot:gene27965-49723_t